MKKISNILVLGLCLAAFFTSCIKEDVELATAKVNMTLSTRAVLSSSEQGDSIADINVWAFACDEEGEVSADKAVAWRRISAASAYTTVDVHLQFSTCKDNDPHYYKLIAVLNQAQFGAVDGITAFDGNTTYSQLASATFVNNNLMAMHPDNGPGANPKTMPISHWTIIKFDADEEVEEGEDPVFNNGNTHSANCYSVQMPVYRAVAKTQLLVAKTNDSTPLVIKDVTISSSAFPTKGVLLSAAKGNVEVKVAENGTKTYLPADFQENGSTTPMWNVADADVSTAEKTVDIYNPAEDQTGKSITKVMTQAQHASAQMTDFDYVTSYFLYENKVGSNAWNIEPEKKGGYYMTVTYDIGEVDNDGKAKYRYGYVWLPAVVRNHDYQVRALVEAGGKLSLDLVVKEWVEDSYSWSYTDVVECTQELAWNEGTNIQEAENDTNVQEVILPKSDNIESQTATCSFTISAPVDAAHWRASFVRGDINAFKFVTSEGEVSTVKGKIGEAATLTIRTTNHQVDDTKMAYLDIVVVTNDGRTLSANSAVMGNNSYRIVQELTKQNN